MSYQTLSHWTPKKQKESWVNLPSGSQYELNTNVSTQHGPAWGTKNAIKLSKSTKMVMGIVVASLVIILLWYFLIHKKSVSAQIYYF